MTASTRPSARGAGGGSGAGSLAGPGGPRAAGVAVAVGAVVLVSVLFAVNGTVAKLAMQAGLSPTRLVELRTLGSAVVLAVALIAVSPRGAPTAGPGAGSAGCPRGGRDGDGAVAVPHGDLPPRVGLALLVEYTAPVLVALWARFVLREHVRARVWWALAACLAGLSLVAQVGPGVALDALGMVAAGGAAVALAAYYLLGDRLVRARSPLSTQTWSMVFAAALWIVLQPLWTFDPAVLGDDVVLPGALAGSQAPLWFLVAWIVVLGTVVPYVLVLVGVSRLGPARTGLLGMIEPVAAGAAAWVVLGESMTAVQLVGGAVVLAGVAMAETARRGPAVEPAGDALVAH